MAFDPYTALLELGKTTIEKIWPDPIRQQQELLKLREMTQKGDLAALDAHVKLMQGQMEINKIEAASDNIFKSGWRPFVGWSCGSAFLYAGLLEPLMRFVATVVFEYNGAFPVVDTSMMIPVLMGMLGMGAMRSFDKPKNNLPASKK